MSRSTKLNRAMRLVAGLVGLALAGYIILYFAREATKVAKLHFSGSIRSDVRVISDSLHVDTLFVCPVFTWVDTTDFMSAPYPQAGDTIVAVNDSALDLPRWLAYFGSLRAPGEEIPLSFRYGDEVLRTVVRTRAPPLLSLWPIIVLQLMQFLTSGLFIGVGLWAFFSRPDSAAVRALAFGSFAVSAYVIGEVGVLPGQYAAFRIPFIEQIKYVLDYWEAFAGAFWLNLQLLFPRPVKFMREHPVLAYGICYLPTVAVIGATGRDPSQPWPYVLGVMLVQLLAGLIVLAVRYKRAEDRLERRQLRLVLLGTGVGVGGWSMLTVATRFLGWRPGGWIDQMGLFNVYCILLLVIPVTFALAFRRYRLLDVEGKLRRGTRYVLTIAALIGVVAAIGYFAESSLRRTVEGGNTLAIIIMLVLAAALVPAVKAMQGVIEKWFYPERRRLRQMIYNFLQRALSIADKETFWSELQVRLREGLRVETVHPVLLVAGNGHYSCLVAGVTPFTTASVFLDRLAQERRPVLVDEVIASARLPLTAGEAEWLEQQRVGLVLPLISHSTLIGFLGVGQKAELEDYTAEELRILDSLSSQIALAGENIRLLEENIIKKQLEEQLQIARRIQQGFLPQEIPPVKGLEIAAGSRFCLDVAGDYYDVILLEDGRAVLAVGDVSGKGIGAALLMANLQASLRTLAGMGLALEDAVARVNDVICRNTPLEQYITFFAGIFDPQTSLFTYVNAGHNPPILLRGDQSVELLDVGGLILGMLPQIEYRQAKTRLDPGDLLLMYTDGVSEAMNEDDEEFGEERLRQFLRQKSFLPTAVALEKLEKDVCEHRGHEPLEDDFTIVLVRRV